MSTQPNTPRSILSTGCHRSLGRAGLFFWEFSAVLIGAAEVVLIVYLVWSI